MDDGGLGSETLLRPRSAAGGHNTYVVSTTRVYFASTMIGLVNYEQQCNCTRMPMQCLAKVYIFAAEGCREHIHFLHTCPPCCKHIYCCACKGRVILKLVVYIPCLSNVAVRWLLDHQSNDLAMSLTINGRARNGIAVFSGGTAANNLVDVFESVRDANQSTLAYIIPVSDNGGSSSELIRVFGGPGKPISQLVVTR